MWTTKWASWRVVVVVLAVGFSFFVAPTPSAYGLSSGTVCPSSALKQTNSPWDDPRQDSTPSVPFTSVRYDATGFSSEPGSLAGCATSVTVAGTSGAGTGVDYYLLFESSVVSGLDLFGTGSTLNITVEGAPGASGWYVIAFDRTSGDQLTQVYGGTGSGGRFNYLAGRRLPDGSSLAQPSLADSPTYSVSYGFSVTESQRSNINAGGLAIYIGYLGSSVAGALDTVNSVRLTHYYSDPVPVPLQRPATPAIGLKVEAVAGAAPQGRAVDYVGFRMKPGSPYSLVIEPTGQVLASGVVDSRGDFSGRPPLPTLGPGAYSVVLKSIGEDGKSYRLSQVFEVGSDSLIQSVSEPVGTIRPGTATSLPATGVDSKGMPLWSLLLVAAGLAIFANARRRFSAISEEEVS